MWFQPRYIPVLLIRNGRLVKTMKFGRETYLGDPMNAVRIFNEKGVDELCIIDISLADRNRPPDFEMIKNIVNEAFVPVSYGGRVSSLEIARRLLGIGVEKVILNSVLHSDLSVLEQISGRLGSQAAVASIDYKSSLLGRLRVYCDCGRRKTVWHPKAFALRCAQAGAGEILLNSIERDGTMRGYDIATIRDVAAAVSIPVVALGGAGKTSDLRDVVEIAGASAAAAGSFFVFKGPRRAPLISYEIPT